MNIRERVQARVDALGKSPITLAKRVGLERGFIRDILSGRKKAVGIANLTMVAEALECDPGYLTGDLDVPQAGGPVREDEDAPIGLQVMGICEAGVWRKPGAMQFARTRVAVSPELRFPKAPQACYRIRGDALDCLHLADGMYVRGIEHQFFTSKIRPLETGMFVVLRRERKHLREVELSLRLVEITARVTRLKASPEDRGPGFEAVELEHPPEDESLTPLIVVTASFRLFL